MKPYPKYLKSDPTFYRSSSKIPGSPLIFFVHFYGGHQKVLKRHITLVNALGFDAFCFNMPTFTKNIFEARSESGFGLKHLYADMVTFFLDQIPEEKIVFSFSNPSASAIEAISKRIPQKNDVLGLICDSGPSQAFVRSAWNLAIKTQRAPRLMFFFSLCWSLRLHHDIPAQIAKLPNQFPVLAIRGGKDPVIPPWHIEKTFVGHKNLDLHVMDLPEAGHLDGLKKFPQDYEKGITAFLSKFAKH